MTPADAFHELLARLGASYGAAVLVSDEELNQWPETAVLAMKKAGLLSSASPASSVVCPGCEQQCHMPVHTLPAGNSHAAFFVVCDKRDDINRVPVSEAMLKRWSTSLRVLAGLVTHLLGTTGADGATGQRSELGVVKGGKHSSHVVLVADGGLSLHVAGHTVALADVLMLDGNAFRLDKRAIVKLVDKPIAGAGDQESAHQRRDRLTRAVREEKAKGNSRFLQTVAEKEGISVSRLKQILPASPKKASAFRSW